MKLYKNLLYGNGVALFVLGVCGGIMAGSIGIGAVLCLIALFNLPFLVIYLVNKNWLAVKTSLLVIGVTPLVGFSICSTASWGSFH
jgi:hypothetical protein